MNPPDRNPHVPHLVLACLAMLAALSLRRWLPGQEIDVPCVYAAIVGCLAIGHRRRHARPKAGPPRGGKKIHEHKPTKGPIR